MSTLAGWILLFVGLAAEKASRWHNASLLYDAAEEYGVRL